MSRQAALITGGAIRVGKSIALHLASQGYDIAFTYLSHDAEAKDVAAEITAMGRQCLSIRADITQTDRIDQVVKEAHSHLPHLDLLVNNAAIFFPASLQEMREDDYDSLMALNTKAPVFLMQKFANHISQGCIINIIDSFSEQLNSSYFPYLLSKRALKDATLLAAHSLAPDFRVHAVSPGSMLPSPGYGDDYFERKRQSNPLNILPTIEQVAQTVHMLHQSPWLTGEILHVDAGEHIE